MLSAKESDKRNIKLTIEYDGINYSGWQIQNNAKTIQGIITESVRKLTKEDVKIIGSSRTDAGVHAYGQVANFMTYSKIPPEKFAYAINYLLPEDIVIKESSLVPMDFHARFSTKEKKYIYLIYNSKQPSPILRNRAFHTHYFLNFEEMSRMSQFFVGTHDFCGFRSAGCSAISTVRTIESVILSKEEELIKIEIRGNGFLYNMVRIIAGTLIYVGMGKIDEKQLMNIFTTGDRRLAGKTLPAQGLYLSEIIY